MDYQYPLSKCDVEDRSALEEFRIKRAQWLFWLNGDEKHSLWKQLNSLLWNDAIFRFINESRRVGSEAGGAFAANSGFLAGFIDQGYVASQVLAVRRLIEPEARTDDRQSISIKRVLRDIRQHRHLLSREIYISFDGLPYDYTVGRDAFMDRAGPLGGPVQVQGMPTEGPDAWCVSEDLHEHFDTLSGVSPDARTRKDLIEEKVFDQISNALAINEFTEVSNFANKMIAHAADPLSRATVSEADMSITMGKLHVCHTTLYSVLNTIYGPLLWVGGSGGIPTPQFDICEHLDQPWLSPELLEQVRAHWDQHVADVEGTKAMELNV